MHNWGNGAFIVNDTGTIYLDSGPENSNIFRSFINSAASISTPCSCCRISKKIIEKNALMGSTAKIINTPMIVPIHVPMIGINAVTPTIALIIGAIESRRISIPIILLSQNKPPG